MVDRADTTKERLAALSRAYSKATEYIRELEETIADKNTDLAAARERAEKAERERDWLAEMVGEMEAHGCTELVNDIRVLVYDSDGVAGYHMTGEVATWQWLFSEGGFDALGWAIESDEPIDLTPTGSGEE